ncbi:hypothetical protein [Streptomyces sp. RK75]|uniref:hypothetical protein n=1 Tax=Streptomyces sp. RK75 TaxID=2824895 RepID=UPI001B35F320|nr:hypothetical protein [Streptomyces sp. RK75]MBQ0864640.1 hypothetical protein [Streptomyces sp. RK75]
MYGDGPIRNRTPRADRVDVDVVTAVHAAYASFLPSLWKSLREQTRPRWTWWAAIDGDADEVADVLRGCGAALDPRVRVGAHGGAPLGPAIVRNLALHRGGAATSRRHPDQRSERNRSSLVEGLQVRGVRSRVAGSSALPPWSG